jgi:two-component system, chemotaxis family, sensor kinase CheA
LIVVVDPFQIIQSAFYPQEVVAATVQRSDSIELVGDAVAGRILLVEDTVFFQRAITKVLERRGYQVVFASNGVEALEQVKKEARVFDLIVSDIEMPKMNGFELARALRQFPPYKSVPLLAVSSKADAAFRKEGLAAGFDMYLEKLKPEVLLAAIAELLRGKKDAA